VRTWKAACLQAGTALETCPAKEIGDWAVDEASRLLALARYLKGVACPACRGFGERAYSSTATWRGGMGGSMITSGVCDHCWGSGRTDQNGPNLRAIQGEYRRLELESSRKWFEEKIGASMGTVRQYFPAIAGRLKRTRWGGDYGLQRVVEIVIGALEELGGIKEA